MGIKLSHPYLVYPLILFFSFVVYQSSDQYETIYPNNASIAKKALSKGDSVTIGWKSNLKKKTIRHMNTDGFTTSDGDEISYSSIVFLRKGERVSVPSMQWSSHIDNVTRLKQMLAEGLTVSLILKMPDAFATKIENKNDEGIFTSNGKFIHFEEIGYIKKKLSIAKAFPKTLIRDILIVPLFLVWVFVDFMAVLGYH